jgi:hypothetical protein
LRVEHAGAGEAVGIAAFERHLDGDDSVRKQFHPRRREIDLMGLCHCAGADDNEEEGDRAQDAAHQSISTHCRAQRAPSLGRASRIGLPSAQSITPRAGSASPNRQALPCRLPGRREYARPFINRRRRRFQGDARPSDDCNHLRSGAIAPAGEL